MVNSILCNKKLHVCMQRTTSSKHIINTKLLKLFHWIQIRKLLTGLDMIPIKALGQTSAQALARSRTMEALVLKRSSRVIPGFLGTPAGIITTSAPFRASWKTKDQQHRTQHLINTKFQLKLKNITITNKLAKSSVPLLISSMLRTY